MPSPDPEITPKTTVHEMLEAFPELEETLIGIAAPFKKLKNPFLRKTIAKVATMKHISAVGQVPLNELLNTLRVAVGQPRLETVYEEENYFGERPDWFAEESIAVSINEAELKDDKKMALVAVLTAAKDVPPGGIIELVTTFLPAPGIDAMKGKGYAVWTVKQGNDLIRSYFLKN